MRSKEMDIAVIEDEKIWLDVVVDYISKSVKKMSKNAVIRTYSSATEFLDSNRDFDIIFADIELGDMDGLSMIGKYTETHECISIVFTSHTEFSMRGYRVNAFRYIDKKSPEDIDEALVSAVMKLRRYHSICIPVLGEGDKNFMIGDIQYAESLGHDVCLVLTGNRKIRTSISLKSMEERLSVYDFIRIHRSYLVNPDNVRDIKRYEASMKDGKCLPISRMKYDVVSGSYYKFKYDRANM